MSKTLWNTIKIQVPEEMVNITKKDKITVKKSLTKTNNVSKANKEPSIKIIPGNVNKPKIISDGKEWNVEELKIKMKKANELSKKNEGKEYKKKSENKILKTYVKTVDDKIKEAKRIKEVKKEPTPKINEIKTQNNKLTGEQIIVNEWGTPHNHITFYQYDEKAYKNIEDTIIKENKLNHHIFTPNLLSFTKKYNDKIVKNSLFNDYKDGMDLLYKGLYNIIENIIDSNDLKMKPGSPVDVFKDRKDYNLGLKYVSKQLAYKIYSNKETKRYY